MTMITPSYLGETIEYSSLHACRSTLEDPTEKLSKRDRGLTLRSLREVGIAPEAVAGYLAHSLGLIDRAERCRPVDLVPMFAWERIGHADWTLPEDLAVTLS